MVLPDLELWSFTFRRATLPELALAAADAGFAAVTLTPQVFVRSGGDTADLRRQVDGAGVRVTFVDGLCTALPGTNLPPGEPTIDDCIHIAHATGAGAINLVHATGVPTPVAELADAFGRACERAAGEDLRLAIEFLPDTGIPDLATAAAIVRAAGAANGSVLLDTWHFARGGGTLADLDAGAAALVGALQISDRSPEQDAEPYVPRRGRKLPGDGSLPLREIVDRVRARDPTSLSAPRCSAPRSTSSASPRAHGASPPRCTRSSDERELPLRVVDPALVAAEREVLSLGRRGEGAQSEHAHAVEPLAEVDGVDDEFVFGVAHASTPTPSTPSPHTRRGVRHVACGALLPAVTRTSRRWCGAKSNGPMCAVRCSSQMTTSESCQR